MSLRSRSTFSVLARSHELGDGRHAWIQVISGGLDVNGYSLEKGDGAAISDEKLLKIAAVDDNTEFLLFDLN